MLKNIRAFFESRAVLEVETPLLSRYATTDPHLESFCTNFREQVCYLNTSPEYAMKRLLAEKPQPIYQICKAFREDEPGVNHNPEFTLLEWYRPGFDMQQLMAELAELMTMLCRGTDVEARFESLSYQQAFTKTTSLNPHQATARDCRQFAEQNNIEIPQGLTEADDVNNWLDWLLMQRVVPAFRKDGFTFLYDYPATQCALAKIEKNAEQEAVAKRFELFFGEIELANGFFELTDADEQLRRFQQENKTRVQKGFKSAQIDENFIAALNHGLPDCSGVAVGLDRLLMVLSATGNIEQVLSFAWKRA